MGSGEWRPPGWSGLLQVQDEAPALDPAAQKEDEQHEQEGAVGSSHGLQPSTSGVEVLCSARDLAVRQRRPNFLRTNASPGFRQTMHRSLFATLRLLQLSRAGGMPRSRKTVVRASRTTSIQPVGPRRRFAHRPERPRDLASPEQGRGRTERSFYK